MGKIFGRIDDDLEKRFRRVANAKFTGDRAPLSSALEEAIEKWIEDNIQLYKEQLKKELEDLEK